MAAETGRYSAGASAVGLVGRDWRCWVCILGGSCAGLRDGYPTVYLSSPYRAKSKQKLGVAWYAHSARLSRSHTPQSVPKHQSNGGQRIPPRPRQRQVQIFAGAHSHPMMSLDAHERPPDHIRNAYKKYQKLRGSALDNDPQLLDLRARTSVDQLQVVRSLSPKALGSVFRNFMPDSSCDSLAPSEEPVPVYEHRHMPGRHNFVLWTICLCSHFPNLDQVCISYPPSSPLPSRKPYFAVSSTEISQIQLIKRTCICIIICLALRTHPPFLNMFLLQSRFLFQRTPLSTSLSPSLSSSTGSSGG